MFVCFFAEFQKLETSRSDDGMGPIRPFVSAEDCLLLKKISHNRQNIQILKGYPYEVITMIIITMYHHDHISDHNDCQGRMIIMRH